MKSFPSFSSIYLFTAILFLANFRQSFAETNYIYTLAQLSNVAVVVSNGSWSGDIRLMNDIDASDTSNWHGGEGWLPIGTVSQKWSYTFDGGGFTIENLWINRPNDSYVGFIGFSQSGATISNLRLTSCDITGNSHVGGMVGIAFQSRLIYCHTDGSVSGNSRVGGLIGNNYDVISYNDSSCNVQGNSGTYIGGLIGYNELSASVSYCFANGDVIANNASSYSGGFIGFSASSSSIQYSYSTGNVYGSNYVGGFSGYTPSGATIVNCYSSGSVTGSLNYGGFVGDTSLTITDSYYDSEISGQSDANGGTTAKTSLEMYTESTFSTWDFSSTWEMKGYPRLQWENDYLSTPINEILTTTNFTNNQASQISLYSATLPGYYSFEYSGSYTYFSPGETTDLTITNTQTLYYFSGSGASASEIKSNTYTIDYVPTISFNYSNISTNESLTIKIQVNEANGYYRVGTNDPYSTISVIGEDTNIGTYSNTTVIYYYSQDSFSLSATNSNIITFDYDEPIFEFIEGTNEDYQTVGDYTLAFRVDENYGYYSTNGGVSFQTLSNGTTNTLVLKADYSAGTNVYYFQYYTEDEAGNSSEISNITYILEFTNVIEVSPSFTSNQASLISLYSSSEPGYYSFAYSGPYTYFSPGETNYLTITNTKTLYYYSGSGSSASGIISRTYTIDYVPTITFNHSNISTNESFDLYIRVDDSFCYFKVGSSDTYTSIHTTNGNTWIGSISASTVIYYYSEDSFSTSTTNSNTITFETTAPVFEFIEGPDYDYESVGDLTLSFSVDENYGYYSTNGGESFLTLSNGNTKALILTANNEAITEVYDFQYYTKDKAGNSTAITSIKYTIGFATSIDEFGEKITDPLAAIYLSELMTEQDGVEIVSYLEGKASSGKTGATLINRDIDGAVLIAFRRGEVVSKLRIYNQGGRLLRDVAGSSFSGPMWAWEKVSDDGYEVGPGIYFIRIEYENGESDRLPLVNSRM